MSINNCAVLAHLNISTWGTERVDKSQSERINIINKADPKAAKCMKNLMVGTDITKQITDYAARIRLWHSETSMPWENSGARLLPTSLYMSWSDELDLRKKEFERMVNNLIPQYLNLQQQAKYALGDMWNPNDYPSEHEVARKYKWEHFVTEVPSSGHFCVDVTTDTLNQMQKTCDDHVQRAIADAMHKPWKKLHSLLTTMSSKLRTDSESGKKRFHKTFISNALDLSELLQHMNVTNDPQLTKASRQLRQLLIGADLDVIKESKEVRKDMKEQVDNMIDQFQW